MRVRLRVRVTMSKGDLAAHRVRCRVENIRILVKQKNIDANPCADTFGPKCGFLILKKKCKNSWLGES